MNTLPLQQDIVLNILGPAYVQETDVSAPHYRNKNNRNPKRASATEAQARKQASSYFTLNQSLNKSIVHLVTPAVHTDPELYCFQSVCNGLADKLGTLV